MFYVYCLYNPRERAFYYGYSADLRRRFVQHKKENNSWRLVYYEAYASKNDARRREQKFKQYGQARSRLKGRIIDSINEG